MIRRLLPLLFCATSVLAGSDLLRGRSLVFVMPCPGDISQGRGASDDFEDDWGRDDSAMHRFRAAILDVIRTSVARKNSRTTIIETPRLCSDTSRGSRLWDEARERIRSDSGLGLDPDRVVYFSVQELSFSIATSIRRGGFQSTGSMLNGTYRSYTVQDSYKRNVQLDFQLSAFDPLASRLIYRDQLQGYHQWPLIDWISKRNWTGAAEDVGMHLADVVLELSNSKPIDGESVW